MRQKFKYWGIFVFQKDLNKNDNNDVARHQQSMAHSNLNAQYAAYKVPNTILGSHMKD